MISVKQKNIDTQKIKWKSDAIFNSFWVHKFISIFLRKGKKAKIEKIIYTCFYKNRILYNISIIFLFFEILEATKLLINLIVVLGQKKRNKREVAFPTPLNYLNQYKKAIAYLNQTIQQNTEKTLNLKIISEFLLFFQNNTKLYLKKENTKKLSCQNHYLKRYRWQN